MMKNFIIEANEFLAQDVVAYYHQDYFGYKKPGNPNFLNVLKNDFRTLPVQTVVRARDVLVDILSEDVPAIMKAHGISECVLACVPRSKRRRQYNGDQLLFNNGVCMVGHVLEGVIDGSRCVERVIDTKTTHFKKDVKGNDGERPYPNITRDTCQFDLELVEGRTIILVDDIYTKTVNIDEDCIQSLFDYGAKEVIFYAVGRTVRKAA